MICIDIQVVEAGYYLLDMCFLHQDLDMYIFLKKLQIQNF